MSANIKHIRSVEYLHTTTEGEIDIKKSKELLLDIAKEKSHREDFDIILDFRRSHLIISTFEIFTLTIEIAQNKENQKFKIAVLILPGYNFYKAQFFELCSKKRGLQVDVFTNYEDAVEWLYSENIG